MQTQAKEKTTMDSPLTFEFHGAKCGCGIVRAQKAVRALDGVDKVTVNLAKSAVYVEGEPDPQAVVDALQEEGFDASFDAQQQVIPR